MAVAELYPIRCPCMSLIGQYAGRVEELKQIGLPAQTFEGQAERQAVLEAFGYELGTRMDLAYFVLLRDMIMEQRDPGIIWEVLRNPGDFTDPTLLASPTDPSEVLDRFMEFNLPYLLPSTVLQDLVKAGGYQLEVGPEDETGGALTPDQVQRLILGVGLAKFKNIPYSVQQAGVLDPETEAELKRRVGDLKLTEKDLSELKRQLAGGVKLLATLQDLFLLEASPYTFEQIELTYPQKVRLRELGYGPKDLTDFQQKLGELRDLLKKLAEARKFIWVIRTLITYGQYSFHQRGELTPEQRQLLLDSGIPTKDILDYQRRLKEIDDLLRTKLNALNYLARHPAARFMTPIQTEIVGELIGWKEDPYKFEQRDQLRPGQVQRLRDLIQQWYPGDRRKMMESDVQELREILEREDRTDKQLLEAFRLNETVLDPQDPKLKIRTVDLVNRHLSQSSYEEVRGIHLVPGQTLTAKTREIVLGVLRGLNQQRISRQLSADQVSILNKFKTEEGQRYLPGQRLDARQVERLFQLLTQTKPRHQIGYERLLAEGYEPGTPMNIDDIMNYLNVYRLCCRSSLMNPALLPVGLTVSVKPPRTEPKKTRAKRSSNVHQTAIRMTDEAYRLKPSRAALVGQPLICLQPIVEYEQALRERMNVPGATKATESRITKHVSRVRSLAEEDLEDELEAQRREQENMKSIYQRALRSYPAV